MARAARRTSRAQAREEALSRAAAVVVPGRADVVVAGGGAAGLCAAIAAAEAGAETVVLERDLACGQSILATGNGRCNFMNAMLVGGTAGTPAWERYRNPAFVEAVCGPRFGADVLDFFRDCGLAWTEEEGGRLYPLSRQAASVRTVLLARAEEAGVTLAPAREVTALGRADGGWRVTYGGVAAGAVDAAALGLAAGGGTALAAGLGLPTVDAEPVLCPLACEPPEGVSLGALDGRRAHVTARLLRGGREVARERGEALFRAWGLSGIVAFDLSREARPGDVVSLDLTGGRDSSSLAGLRAEGVLDPVVARALGGGQAALARALDLRFVVAGPAEPERAQVTRGGLAVKSFAPQTLEARELPGLFAAGEALDVDGACGGFNLAWAWKSGLVAGAAAAQRARESQRPNKKVV